MTQTKWLTECSQMLVRIKSLFCTFWTVLLLSIFSLLYICLFSMPVFWNNPTTVFLFPFHFACPFLLVHFFQNCKIGSMWQVGLLMWLAESKLTLHMKYICTTPISFGFWREWPIVTFHSSAVCLNSWYFFWLTQEFLRKTLKPGLKEYL